MKVDIGDLCTSCGRDTSFGSVDENGEKLLLFVNRIPSDSDGTLTLQDGSISVNVEAICVLIASVLNAMNAES